LQPEFTLKVVTSVFISSSSIKQKFRTLETGGERKAEGSTKKREKSR
jgi:hypothetical protein